MKSQTEILKLKLKNEEKTEVSLKLKMYENSLSVKKILKELTIRMEEDLKKHFSEIADII